MKKCVYSDYVHTDRLVGRPPTMGDGQPDEPHLPHCNQQLQLTQMTDGDGGKYTYTYDDAGNVTKLTYPNGWVEEYSYDAEGNLLKTVDTDPFHNNKKSTKYQYTYDAEGNLITEYQRDSDGEAGLAANTTYTYDALNRLTGSKKTLDWTRKTYAKTYTYDSLGNLVQENGPDSRDQTTYQYNSLNQMVARKECGYVQSITRIHDYGYTYDGRGNLVKEEEICSPTTQGPKNITIATYTYDETNKMVSGTNKDGEVSNYTFNGLGVRVGTEVIVKDNTHGYTDFHCQTPTVETGIDKPEVVLSDYVIDYTRLNIDQRMLVESETDGYDFRYTYGLDLVNVKATGEGTNWWAQSVKKCVYSDYVHTDRLGSVVNLTDQYGRVPAQIDYDDWGKVTAYQSLNISGGYRTVLPEITYAGHQYDDVLGMYYAKARMYDAENRRFASVDPVKGRITEPMSLVQYLYVVDNPLRWVDLLGRDPMSNYPSAYIQLSNGNVLDEVDWYIHGDPDDYYVDFEAALKAYGVNVGRGELTYSDGAGHQTLYLFSPDQRRYIETQLTYYTACNSISVSSLMREQAANWGVTQNYGNVMMYYSSGTYHQMINFNYFKRLMCDLGYNVTAEVKSRANEETGFSLYKLDSSTFDTYLENYLNGVSPSEQQIKLMSYYLSHNTNGTNNWSVEDKERQKKFIYAYMRNEFGWTPALASAFLGNMSGEGVFSPTNLEDKRADGTDNRWYVDEYDIYDGLGWGLVQLTYYARKEDFRAFVLEEGTELGDMVTQLKYLKKELTENMRNGNTITNMYRSIINDSDYSRSQFMGENEVKQYINRTTEKIHNVFENPRPGSLQERQKQAWIIYGSEN